MKLFKTACLTYNPSNIEYRGMSLDRLKMVELRRGVFDKLIRAMPSCDLFKDTCNYPRRYFDDLMVERATTIQG